MNTDSKKRATLADVARDAGVSTAVVSYVVNNGPRNVSEKTRQRVEAAISKLEYRRNSLASALISGTTNLVGILVPDASNAFFGDLAREFEQEGRRRGYLTLLGNTSNDPKIESEYVHALGDLCARAVFVTSVNPESYFGSGCPKVYVHSAPEAARSPKVLFDEFEGGRVATRHLISLGHKNIHCLAGASGFGPLGERRRGWEHEMAVASLDVSSRAHYIPADRAKAEQRIGEILSGEDRPSALFATTDEQALMALRAASKIGLRVPEDLAIVGYDGISEARMGSVHITTIALPLRALAQKAFDALDQETAKPSQPTILSGDLWIGETCGAKPT